MYEVARAGETVPRAPRAVTVESFRVWREDAASPLVRFDIVCSKGTYVRSLVHDLVRSRRCGYARGGRPHGMHGRRARGQQRCAATRAATPAARLG